jgi:hypothetical protein
MTKVKFIHHLDVSYATGPISGPVASGDVRDATEEEADLLVASGFWDFADEQERAKFLRWRAARDKPEEQDEKKQSKKQAIAKADVTKEVQSQGQQ